MNKILWSKKSFKYRQIKCIYSDKPRLIYFIELEMTQAHPYILHHHQKNATLRILKTILNNEPHCFMHLLLKYILQFSVSIA